MSVNLTQRADASLGLQGPDGDAGAFIYVNIPYTTATPLVLNACTLPRRCVVQSITLVPDTASTNAVTVTCYKAPSGTALGSGTALHSGTGNLQGTAATTQTLTLSTTASVIDVAAGNRIGAVVSGALGAAGSGVITIALNPA